MKKIHYWLAAGLATLGLLAAANPTRAQIFYVADQSGAYKVIQFDAGANESDFAPANYSGTAWNQPGGLAVDRSGRIYVAYTGGGSNYIWRFNADGTGSKFSGLGTNFSAGAGAMAFDTHSNLYLASYYPGTVEKFSPAGADLGSFGNLTLQGADALAFDSKGNLYVSDGGEKQIVKYNAAGQGSVFVTGDYYRGLAFDTNDILYTGVGWSIDKFNPNGTSAGTVTLRSGEFAAEGMLYSQGCLYFTDYLHGTICRIDSLGNEITVDAISDSSDLEWFALVPSAPLLAIAPAGGGQTVVTWPAFAWTNYLLQTVTNLGSTNWINSTNVPTLAGTQYLTTNAIAGKSLFYRLRQP